MFRQISGDDGESWRDALRKRRRRVFAKRLCAETRAPIHKTWMSHAIAAHNKRLATMMKIRVLRPLQRSERLRGGGVGVREGRSDMRQTKVQVCDSRERIMSPFRSHSGERGRHCAHCDVTFAIRQISLEHHRLRPANDGAMIDEFPEQTKR
jgi:hypothetical protein